MGWGQMFKPSEMRQEIGEIRSRRSLPPFARGVMVMEPVTLPDGYVPASASLGGVPIKEQPMAKQALHDRIDWDFTNHTPHPAAIDTIEMLRARFRALGHDVISACPEGRELSLALTKLDESLRDAVAAIARAKS